MLEKTGWNTFAGIYVFMYANSSSFAECRGPRSQTLNIFLKGFQYSIYQCSLSSCCPYPEALTPWPNQHRHHHHSRSAKLERSSFRIACYIIHYLEQPEQVGSGVLQNIGSVLNWFLGWYVQKKVSKNELSIPKHLCNDEYIYKLCPPINRRPRFLLSSSALCLFSFSMNINGATGDGRPKRMFCTEHLLLPSSAHSCVQKG